MKTCIKKRSKCRNNCQVSSNQATAQAQVSPWPPSTLLFSHPVHFQLLSLFVSMTTHGDKNFRKDLPSSPLSLLNQGRGATCCPSCDDSSVSSGIPGPWVPLPTSQMDGTIVPLILAPGFVVKIMSQVAGEVLCG